MNKVTTFLETTVEITSEMTLQEIVKTFSDNELKTFISDYDIYEESGFIGDSFLRAITDKVSFILGWKNNCTFHLRVQWMIVACMKELLKRNNLI